MKGNVMKRLMLWFLLAVLFLPAAPSWAADGGIDTTFGTGGRVTTDFKGSWWDPDEANAVAIQSDGKIVAAGTAGVTDFALARYNTDGTLDTTFGTGGRVTTYSSANTPISSAIASAVAIQSDGKIVVAGYAYNSDQHIDANQYDFALARYNTNGTLDSTFGSGGIVVTAVGPDVDYDYAYAVTIQTDGKIVAAGATGPRSNYGGTNDTFALVRYNANGTLDTSFGTGGKVTTTIGTYSDAYAVAIQTDGKIVATGYSYKGDYADFALARYNTDGTLDTSFGTDGMVTTAISANSNVDNARSVAIQTDGKIVAAGIDSSYNFALVRYNTDGTLDTTFGTGGMVTTTNYDKAYAVAIQSDGKIVAAGHGYSSSSYYTDFVVVRYLTGAATPTPTPLSTPSPTVTSSSTPLSTPTPSSEKGSISGDITDMEGKPIESAKIRLKGKQTKVSKRTTSDEDGYFEFTDLDADTYTIIATRKGYKKGKQVVTLGKGEDADVEIELKKAGKRIIKASAL